MTLLPNCEKKFSPRWRRTPVAGQGPPYNGFTQGGLSQGGLKPALPALDPGFRGDDE